MSARLDTLVEARREAVIGFLRHLVQAGRGGESAVQAELAARAANLGTLENVVYHPADVVMRQEFADPAAMDSGERSAILLRRPGQGGGRSLVIFAHPDSEPFRTPHGWSHDPFAATITAGRLYGWGVADDLAGVACMVEALDVVAASGLVLAGDVTLASTPSKRHARGVCALLGKGLSADAALYLHPAESGQGMREVKTFTSGQVAFEIAVEGLPPPTTEPLPAAFAHQAVNPIEKAFLVHEALRALDRRRGEAIRHPALQAAIGRSTNLMLSHIASGAPGQLSRPAATCTLGGVLAFPPPETLEQVQAQIARAIRDTADPWLTQHPPRIVWRAGTTGAELPSAHPLFAHASAAIAEVTGSGPAANALHTGSDIRHPMVQRGIPTLGLGPLGGDLTQNGRNDEWVDVEDYVRSVKVVASLIAAWCA